MSIRSEVRDLLAGKPGRRIPWFGDLSYYYYSLQRRGRLEERHQGPEGEKRFYADFGVGIYLYTPDVFRIRYSDRVSYTEVNTPERILLRFQTPVGTITSVQDYVPGMYCFAYAKHFVETIEDLRVMRFVFENARYEQNYAAYLSRDRLWGEEGIGFAMAVASMAPLQKLLSRWAGVQTTVELQQDHTAELERTFAAIEESQEPLVEVLAGSPAEVVILPENLASQVVGESLFRRYDMPYYRKIVERLHATGKQVAIHIDGGLKPCLALLSSCGFDIAEAVTPAPFGDLGVEELRRAAGPRLVIWGGLPGGIFSPNYSDRYFDEYVLSVLAHADERFVLGVADQVPPDAVPERIGRVRGLVDANPRSPRKEAASLGKS
jgi:hypothetical protein